MCLQLDRLWRGAGENKRRLHRPDSKNGSDAVQAAAERSQIQSSDGDVAETGVTDRFAPSRRFHTAIKHFSKLGRDRDLRSHRFHFDLLHLHLLLLHLLLLPSLCCLLEKKTTGERVYSRRQSVSLVHETDTLVLGKPQPLVFFPKMGLVLTSIRRCLSGSSSFMILSFSALFFSSRRVWAASWR